MADSTVNHHSLALTFGLLANIVSFVVYLAPLPTFYRIYKKKSTEGFQSVPYVVVLFTSMLWMYYGLIKRNDLLLIINIFGCTVESIYIIIYLTYAPKSPKMLTIKLLLGLNVGLYGFILLVTQVLTHGSKRVNILGVFCSAFTVSMFVAPLGVMRLVIRTKSVEFMPILLSLILTLASIMWFIYGVLIMDYYLIAPNVLGFLLGVAQIVLYCIYKDRKQNRKPTELKVAELVMDMDLKPNVKPASQKMDYSAGDQTKVVNNETPPPEVAIPVNKELP